MFLPSHCTAALLDPAPLVLLSLLNFRLKKGKDILFIFCLRFYGRFLSISIVTAKPMAIAIIMPAIAGTKYMSAADPTSAWVGTSVASGKLKSIMVCVVELKYESDPPNVAVIL